MPEYILLMHGDVADDLDAWRPYFERLRRSAQFEGGSAIGDGVCLKKDGTTLPTTQSLVGYICVTAESIEHAKSLLPGNPHYEAGGAIEVRELPRTG
jgi:hypothetical protein